MCIRDSAFIAVTSIGTTSANAACKVHLGDFDWDSANVHTAIVGYILEHGYGCQVEVTKGSTSPIMAAHYDQQLDIITEVWRDNIVQMHEEAVAAGKIIELGINTPSSTQGFYVDKPTADKYGLKSVEDMKKPEIAIQMRNKLKVWINEVKAKMPEVNEVQITDKVKGGTFTNLNVSLTY